MKNQPMHLKKTVHLTGTVFDKIKGLRNGFRETIELQRRASGIHLPGAQIGIDVGNIVSNLIELLYGLSCEVEKMKPDEPKEGDNGKSD